MQRRWDAVLFDIDGTLIDSNGLHVQAWEEAFRERGHRLAPEAILAQIGKGGDKLVPALLPDAPERERTAIADRHGDIFKSRYLNQARPFAGARALLSRVHEEGVKVVLASSTKQDELDHYVALLGVGDIVTAATSIDDVSQSKPAPDIFATALDKAGVASDRAIAVGDTVWDIEAAAKNGIATIALLSGGIAETTLRTAGAIAIFADTEALLASYATSPLCAGGATASRTFGNSLSANH